MHDWRVRNGGEGKKLKEKVGKERKKKRRRERWETRIEIKKKERREK